MKVFVWSYVRCVSDSWHRSGGLVVFAENEERARELANMQEGCDLEDDEKPCDVREVVGGEEAVYVFPNAGCC